MFRDLNSLILFYAVLLWPGRYVVMGLFDDNWYYAQMMYDSGVWSVRLLLMTIAVTPVLMLINRIGRGAGIGRWLLRRRRHLGLISFVYAALHLIHYVLEVAVLSEILSEVTDLEFAVGWLAFLVFAVLALTSNNRSVRKMGRRWKRLHYWIYPAIALSFLHWYLFDLFTARVMFWLALFVAVKLVHGALRGARRIGV
ncbi:MAG: ferric reductase-like transmembrane domain-containing protein [Sulfitobacter sp.]